MAAPMVASIIVPTYKEVDNIVPLTERLFKALADSKFDDKAVELIFVDDNSADGSKEAAEKMRAAGYNVQMLVRTEERGLSSAVLHGFDKSSGRLLVCMDADLQHPPEVIPHLLEALAEQPFVLGTRYGGGTKIDENWPLHRRVISGGARMLARPLSSLTDPMSGLFGIRRDTYEAHRSDISGLGFKIGLEIYVKCGIQTHAEVPFNFGSRTAGASKLSQKVMVQYIVHLAQLYRHQYPALLVALLMFLVAAFFIMAKLWSSS